MADAIKKGVEAVKDKVAGELINVYKLEAIYFFTEVTSGASFEAHKAAAKDSDRSVGDRVGSGKSCDKNRSRKNRCLS